MTKRQELQRSRKVDHATASQTETWIDRELAGSEFRDVRLNKRQTPYQGASHPVFLGTSCVGAIERQKRLSRRESIVLDSNREGSWPGMDLRPTRGDRRDVV